MQIVPSSLLLHSGKQIGALRWIALFPSVHKPVHWSATMQMQVGKYANVCSIYFQ